jgi:small-conductance mechanosensitive channel
LNQSGLNNLLSYPYFKEAIEVFVTIFIIFLLVHFAQTLAARKIDDKDLRYKTRKAFSMAGYLVTLLAIILIFSEQVTNLTVIIGALSVGIGFALRELIQSLIGWSVISFGGLYKPGERIQVGSIMGDVIDIGPLTTTVMECGGWVKADLYNGRLVRLSNSVVFKDNIINYTSDFPFLWDEIVIPVRTDSDHLLARSIIEKAADTELSAISGESKAVWRNFVRQYRIEDARLDPMISMSFDANWIEFTLRYVVDYRVRRSTKDRLFSSILDGIEATQGKVQIASAAIQLTEIPPLLLHKQRV